MSPCRLTTFPLPKVRWVTETPGKYPVPSGAPSARLSSAGFGRARTGWDLAFGGKRASEKALELAKETLRLAEVGYREGVTPQLDLLDAQSSLTLAQLEYNRAQYSHLIAVVALKVTEGTVIQWNGK